MPSSTDIQGAALLSALFMGLVLVAEVWRRYGTPSDELTRKFVHFLGGFVCLLFPAFISSPWVVLSLALGMVLVFMLGDRLNLLKSLYGVTRRTHGTAYYPLAIFLSFWLAGDRHWLFYASVLTLAVADAGAALVGVRYGRIHYTVEDESKSLEGSLAFLVLAFMAIFIPMYALTSIDVRISVLASLLVALLVTGLESISLKGADNLIIPLGTCLILKRISTKPFEEVLYQNLSLLVLTLIVSLIIWRVKAFNAGGTITCILFCFAAWSLGSEAWAIPWLVGFCVYLLSWHTLVSLQRFSELIRVRIAAKALSVPFSLLLFANIMSEYDVFYGPYLAASGVILTFSLWAHLVQRGFKWGLFGNIVVSIISAVVMVLPALLLQFEINIVAIALLFGCILSISVLNYFYRKYEQPTEKTPHRWDNASVILTSSAPMIVFLAQILGVPEWQPMSLIGVSVMIG